MISTHLFFKDHAIGVRLEITHGSLPNLGRIQWNAKASSEDRHSKESGVVEKLGKHSSMSTPL